MHCHCFRPLDFARMAKNELGGSHADHYVARLMWIPLSDSQKNQWINTIGMGPAEMNNFINAKIDFLFDM